MLSTNFHRDKLTKISYAQIAAINWFIFAIGPSFALLQQDFGVTRTVIAWHNIIGAIGSVVAGITSTFLIRRFGRGNTIRSSSFGLIIGTLFFVLGTSVTFTLPGIFICGYAYVMLVQCNAAFLNGHHKENSPQVISEANALGALIGFIAPITLGIGLSIGIGWRYGLGSVVLALGAIELWRGKDIKKFGTSKSDVNFSGHDREGKLPRLFWPAWVVLASTAGLEASVMTWGADLLIVNSGLARASATASISAIVLGMGIGRFFGSRILQGRDIESIYRKSLFISLIGFALFWQGTNSVVQLAGLAVMGLSMSLHFPLGISRLMRSSDGKPDRATAMSSIGSGAAAGFFPFLVGATADKTSVEIAFSIPALALITAVALAKVFTVSDTNKH